MQITIRKKRWSLVRRALQKARGYCDPPTFSEKKIIIDRQLEGEEELEVLIHEMLHAAFWDLEESAIEETARDIAHVLWLEGFQNNG